MFQRTTKTNKVRGDFIVTTNSDLHQFHEGLHCEIAALTETEFDLDVDLDDDFNVTEKLHISFRANRNGWRKAYRRLRQEFKGRIHCLDKSVAPALATRLKHQKMIQRNKELRHVHS